MAAAVAEHSLGYSVLNYPIEGLVKSERLRRITEVLNRLEHPSSGEKRIIPDWDSELAYILAGGGENIPVMVFCDVYAEDRGGKRYAFEIKAPLPNSDQTKVSKEKLLKIYAMDPPKVDEAYFALPYNPYGRREDYSWGFPSRWFNMQQDRVVLIGDEFWEKIGGVGTYRAFLQAVNELGKEYKDRIYTEFLGIRPPDEI